MRWWLLLGLVLGLGLLNKISMLWFSFGLIAGLLLIPQRRYFLTKGPWLAGLVTIVLFLPHILWQVTHDWPTLEFIQNATGEKMASISPVAFMTEQILNMNPVSFPIWFLGLLFFLLFKQGRRYRVLGLLYVVVLVLLIVNQKSRPGYLAPAYPMLFAGGAVAIEMFSIRRGWSWLKPFSLISVIVSGLFMAPLGMPVLPVETYIRYAERLGVGPSTHEKKEVGKLPQHYADMHGWEKMVATVAGVYNALSPEEQSQCTIFAGNYGEAGAVDFLGRKYNLPKAISGHNNYWLWGFGDYTGNVTIHMGSPSEETLRTMYEEVHLADTFQCEYCMPYENNMAIYVCKGIRSPLRDMWPRFKHFE